MKSSVFVLIAAAGVEHAAATFSLGDIWKYASAYTAPGYMNVGCNPMQQSGWDWSGLGLGAVSSYGGFNFYGWTSENVYGKRHSVVNARTFGSIGKAISGTCTSVKSQCPSISAGAGVSVFSVSKIDISVEFDTRLEFHYEMADGSECKHSAYCSSKGTSVENTQCGGAKKVWVVYPKQSGYSKSSCGVKIHQISWDCGNNNPYGSKPPPYYSQPPSYTPPAYTPPSYQTSSAYQPPYQYTTSAAVYETTTSAAVYETTTTAETTTSTEETTTAVYETTTAADTTTTTTSAVYETTAAESTTTTEETTTAVYETTTAAETTTAEETTTTAEETTTTSAVYETTVAETTTSAVYEITTSAAETTTSVIQTYQAPPPPAETYQAPPPAQTYQTPPSVLTTLVASAPSEAASPQTSLPCPAVLPKCLNTWLHLVPDCKDNTDHSCYCPSQDIIEKVYHCVYSHGKSGDDISGAIVFLQGMCAQYAPQNPYIATGAAPITSIITVTAAPPAPTAGYTTVVVATTVTVPCTSEGTTIAGSSTTMWLSTQMTVPQVSFTIPPETAAPPAYTPPPVYSAPAYTPPAYTPPAATYAPPAESAPAPAPTYEAPAPTYQAPAPTYEAPAPTYEAPAPPAESAAAPTYVAPPPVYSGTGVVLPPTATGIPVVNGAGRVGASMGLGLAVIAAVVAL